MAKTRQNTPDRDTKVSPAMALFGRKMRDFLPTPKKELMEEMREKLADCESKLWP